MDEQPFVNVSEFGAFPVQVQGHSHLHDCLEAATCNPDVQQEVCVCVCVCVDSLVSLSLDVVYSPTSHPGRGALSVQVQPAKQSGGEAPQSPNLR